MSSPNGGDPLVEVRNVKTYFPIRRGLLQREVGHVGGELFGWAGELALVVDDHPSPAGHANR